MDFQALFNAVSSKLGGAFPLVIGAVFVLIVGWLVALLVRAAVRRALRVVRLNERSRSITESPIDFETGIAAGVYYLVLLFVMIAFFNVLKLRGVTGPLQSMAEGILGHLPNVIAAGVLALVGVLAAVIVRRVVTTGLGRTSMDEKVSSEAGMRPISDVIGHVAFWLMLLFFLPAVLETLGLQALLDPVNEVVGKALNLLPNLAAAAAIGFVGWIVARIVRDLAANLLGASGVDALGRRAGMSGEAPLSRLLGLLAYILVLVPAVIAALRALQLESISAPATRMLETLMAGIPALFGAAVVLGIGLLLAELVAGLLTSLLEGLGFNKLPGKLGVGTLLEGAPAPSQLAGQAARIVVILFAAVEAGALIGFTQLSGLLSRLITLSGHIVLGMIIVAVGLWLANLAHGALSRASVNSAGTAAQITRFAILALFFAMGLRAMGIADEIVEQAFTLTLGAIAVAAAIAFGLGGREAASRQLDSWLGRTAGGHSSPRSGQGESS